jgi:hypothetical protein
MVGIPVTALIGRYFTEDDNLQIGQCVWDNFDPAWHRVGFGSGAVGPRWYPGVDTKGSLFLDYGAVIKSQNKDLGDTSFGFEGDSFVVRIRGVPVLKTSTLGIDLIGAFKQTGTSPEFLPSNAGLSQLLFPLFNDKTMLAQFSKSGYAYIDVNNSFKAYKDINGFISDIGGSFTRGGSIDSGFARKVDYKGNFSYENAGKPRITYSPRTKKCLGLLIEPSSTNILTKSYSLDTWNQTNLTPTSEASATWANKGLDTPFIFIESNTNSEHSISHNMFYDPSKVLSASFFIELKAFTGSRQFTLFLSDLSRTNIVGITYESINGQKPTVKGTRNAGGGVIFTSEVEDVGSGIYRVKLSGVVNSNATPAIAELSAVFASLGNSGNSNLSFTPDPSATNWARINNFQVETNSYTTSYMSTNEVAMSRNFDQLVLNMGVNARYSSLEGSIELKFKANLRNKAGNVLMSVQNASRSSYVDLYISSIDANSIVLGVNRVINGATVENNANYATTSFTKSVANFSFTEMPADVNSIVLTGASGTSLTASSLTYE